MKDRKVNMRRETKTWREVFTPRRGVFLGLGMMLKAKIDQNYSSQSLTLTVLCV